MSELAEPVEPSPQPGMQRRVLDAGALKALGHPLRIQIVDILAQRGPQTASSLAGRLGESSGATSYHLRALAKHDLIREVEGKGTGRERWWERPRDALILGDPETMRSPAGRAAAQLTVTEMYRQRNDELMRYLEAGLRGDPDEWDATLTLSIMRLTKEQFSELAASITALIDDASEKHRDQRGDDVSLYSVRLDMIPLESPSPATRRDRP